MVTMSPHLAVLQAVGAVLLAAAIGDAADRSDGDGNIIAIVDPMGPMLRRQLPHYSASRPLRSGRIEASSLAQVEQAQHFACPDGATCTNYDVEQKECKVHQEAIFSQKLTMGFSIKYTKETPEAHQMIRCDDKWRAGAEMLYLTADGKLKLTVKGNTPETVLFDFHFLPENVYNVAVSYDAEPSKKAVRLYVAGKEKEHISYTEAGNIRVTLGKLGCHCNPEAHDWEFKGTIKNFYALAVTFENDDSHVPPGNVPHHTLATTTGSGDTEDDFSTTTSVHTGPHSHSHTQPTTASPSTSTPPADQEHPHHPESQDEPHEASTPAPAHPDGGAHPGPTPAPHSEAGLSTAAPAANTTSAPAPVILPIPPNNPEVVPGEETTTAAPSTTETMPDSPETTIPASTSPEYENPNHYTLTTTTTVTGTTAGFPERRRRSVVDLTTTTTTSTTLLSDAQTTTQTTTPVDQNPNVREGWCSPWSEGGSFREKQGADSTGITYFPANWLNGRSLSAQECWNKCTYDRACEQAVYRQKDGQCWIGIDSIDIDPGATGWKSGCTDCKDMCFAKNGFKYTNNFTAYTRLGYCSPWKQLHWSGCENRAEYTCVCDEEDKDLKDLNHCSFFGPEWELSERGCWAKCAEHHSCKQAVYSQKPTTNAEGVTRTGYRCLLGSEDMSTETDPGDSGFDHSCDDCADKCWSKMGYAVGILR